MKSIIPEVLCCPHPSQGKESTLRHQENPETGQQQRLVGRKARKRQLCLQSLPTPSLTAVPQLTGDSYLNQCNQRWNDNGDAHCQNCRKLVAQGFPCPCGHAHKDILLSCKNNRRKLKASEWWRVPGAQAGGVGRNSTCVHVPGGTATKQLHFRF